MDGLRPSRDFWKSSIESITRLHLLICALPETAHLDARHHQYRRISCFVNPIEPGEQEYCTPRFSGDTASPIREFPPSCGNILSLSGLYRGIYYRLAGYLVTWLHGCVAVHLCMFVLVYFIQLLMVCMFRYMGCSILFSLHMSLCVNAPYRFEVEMRDFLLVRLKPFIYARFHA